MSKSNEITDAAHTLLAVLETTLHKDKGVSLNNDRLAMALENIVIDQLEEHIEHIAKGKHPLILLEAIKGIKARREGNGKTPFVFKAKKNLQ